MMERPKFTYVTYINCPAQKLWEALTNPEFTQQYWGGHRIQSEWTKGAKVKFIKPDSTIEVKGEILECDPPRMLSYTWTCSSWPSEAKTRVTFEISASFGVTRLTVTHDGLEPGSKMLLELSQGWQAILSNLKTLLETGSPLPLTWKG